MARLDEQQEIWKDIKGYEGFYQVSNMGRVKSLERIILNINGKKRIIKEKILKHKNISSGYLAVILYKCCKGKTMYIHRLVANAFIDNPNNYIDVNHIDGNKCNNFFSNLEWVTRSNNIKHAYNTGLRKAHIDKARQKAIEEKSIPVLQFDKNNFLIAEYKSINQAVIKTNISFYYIKKCCDGNIIDDGNYIWRYKK